MAKLRLPLIIGTIFGFVLQPVYKAAAAKADNSEPTEFVGNDVNMLGSIVWFVISLAIVIVLIVVVLKWLSKRNRAWGTNTSIRSLGGIGLGQNSSVQVIELAGRLYVVGVGESVTLLDKLEDAEQVRVVKEAMELKQQSGWLSNPIELLAAKRRKKNAQDSSNEPTNESWNSTTSFQQLLNNQMHIRSDRKKQLEDLLNDTKTNERLMDDEK